ncbi:unnamed protein product [Brassicogethes aeneus]|uniref:Alpha-1,3-glucosyltransferase n=1 Tax=Brassicogethes aeneus TaxID=1431903 RepID=A0A9P0BAT2_BRAAE|nr:unnamed protein product [Brassicogethes aeneus]
MIITITILTTCIKLLLIPSYKSTDFEVHRNWLAITHNLSYKKWYFEDTSEWTLDYPPLFAWFEYFLSFFAVFFDRNMLVISNLNYASDATVVFQRLSVILTDFIYVYGVYRVTKSLSKSWRNEVVLPIILITNCGLIMLDHIHFQYNGMMYGILLISIANMIKENYVRSAIWFTILLNFKHIYIYLAPAYFTYLLRHYCLKNKSVSSILTLPVIKNISTLGAIVLGIFLVVFAPFADHIGQVLSRLFPFKRGLCHAYWAPNVWALYNTLDKAGFLLMSNIGLMDKDKSTAAMTGGLVQEFSHSLLPNIYPLTTILLTIICMLPFMVKLFVENKSSANFLRCLTLCALTSFLFGWHVHEKAILMAIIPLSILSIMEARDANIFLILSVVGHFSLFPLLYPGSLLIIKVILLLLHSIYSFHSLYKMYPLTICKYSLPLLNHIESMYLLGLNLVFLYENVLHQLLGLSNKLPFLPLMITSVYCSIGIIYCWVKLYINFFKKSNLNSKIKTKVK